MEQKKIDKLQEQKAIKWMQNVRDDAVVILEYIAKENADVSPMLRVKLIDADKRYEILDKLFAEIQKNDYIANRQMFDKAWDQWCDLPIAYDVDKVAEYEDAKEQGLLLRLPCKVDTELFAILNKCRANEVSEEECDDEINCIECQYSKQLIVIPVLATKDILVDEFFSKHPWYIWGKTLFTTKEEAEKVLDDLRN